VDGHFGQKSKNVRTLEKAKKYSLRTANAEEDKELKQGAIWIDSRSRPGISQRAANAGAIRCGGIEMQER
jgi:hypothetical protein